MAQEQLEIITSESNTFQHWIKVVMENRKQTKQKEKQDEKRKQLFHT